jgi:dipeptidyl aminopeptidase/acylaminoacyl peptidase
MKSINKKTIAIGIVLIIIISIGILGYRADQPYPTQPKQAWIDSVSGPDVIRESTFIKNDGLMLEADLILPVGGADKKPAVVFVGGSGDGLYQGYSNGFLETFIQGIFLPRNFAVFYFNKRGMGQSEGSWLNNSIQGRAEDAYAAVEFLKSHPAIDSQNIGVIGHSQGGWVVNLVASQHEDIAFFISLAGPTTTVIGNMEDNYRGAYICEGFKGEGVFQIS